MTSSPVFETRALEFHGDRMWSWKWVKKGIDFMAAQGMNTLVFHRNDLLDLLAFPSKYFSTRQMWARWPVRYHNLDNNRQYLRQVIRYAHDRGIRFFLEIKELSYHESILAAKPDLWGPSGIAAMSDFWWEFLDAKIGEALDEVPGLDGVIVSPATRESKISISTNATRGGGQSMDPVDWYERLIRILFEALDGKGKTLVVRDFSYSRDHQGAVIEAADRVSPRIVISLKNTPHDFYPTFPDNAHIGAVGDHPQWVEFDTWGQFFGLGVFPSMVVDDMRERFRHCAASSVSGVMARTDWEVISDGGVFNTLNMANLYGFARLAQSLDTDTEAVMDAWLDGPVATTFGGGLDEADFWIADNGEVRDLLKSVMRRSWAVMEKTVFVLRHVFHEDCMFPDTVEKAFMMMEEIHSLAEWDPAAEGALAPGEATLEKVFAEKAEAREEARRMRDDIVALQGSVPPVVWGQFHATADLLQWYVEGFDLCARACFHARDLDIRRGEVGEGAARQGAEALDAYRRRLETKLEGTRHPYLVYWMLDTRRLERLSADVRRRL